MEVEGTNTYLAVASRHSGSTCKGVYRAHGRRINALQNAPRWRLYVQKAPSFALIQRRQVIEDIESKTIIASYAPQLIRFCLHPRKLKYANRFTIMF